MTIRILVVCEGSSDQRTGCGLADRVLIEAHDWMDGILDTQRSWVGVSDTRRCLLWKHVADEYEAKHLPHFIKMGRGLKPDAWRAARALVLADLLGVQAVCFLRDLNDQPARKVGMEQARKHISHMLCVIGVANRMQEAWLLNGFLPNGDVEWQLLLSERKKFQFDPTLEPERLSAKKETAKKSPKRVVKVLTAEDGKRRAACWEETPLDLLRKRGVGSGLTDYLEEVRLRLAPIFGNGAHRS
jgi:hypothetical protein